MISLFLYSWHGKAFIKTFEWSVKWDTVTFILPQFIFAYVKRPHDGIWFRTGFASWRSSAMANLRADIPDVYRLAYVLMIVTNMCGRQMDMNMTIWCFILLRGTVYFLTNRLIDAFSCQHFSDDAERRRVSNPHCLLNSLGWRQQNSSLLAFLWGQSTKELFSKMTINVSSVSTTWRLMISHKEH